MGGARQAVDELARKRNRGIKKKPTLNALKLR
jgi:hypothetical protein